MRTEILEANNFGIISRKQQNNDDMQVMLVGEFKLRENASMREQSIRFSSVMTTCVKCLCLSRHLDFIFVIIKCIM